jgi:tRNA (guanine-N7-)-methyltransferase
MSEKIKTNAQNYIFRPDFQYSHDNPYHDKLAAFDHFVLRDDEGEKQKSLWNKEVFQNSLPLWVEIGSGYGEFMMEFCEKHPELNFIGMDHRFKRSFQVARNLATLPHRNFRFLRARGERLEFLFGSNELDKILYFFPDPWPKKRHHKKRLFQTRFLDASYECLKPQGEILIKTDHDDYYQWMLEFIKKDDRFEMIFHTTNLREEFPEHFLASFQTKFEKIFISQGVKIKAIILKSKKL